MQLASLLSGALYRLLPHETCTLDSQSPRVSQRLCCDPRVIMVYSGSLSACSLYRPDHFL